MLINMGGSLDPLAMSLIYLQLVYDICLLLIDVHENFE